ALHPHTLQFLISVWAKIKGKQIDRTELTEVARKLDGLPADDRKSAYYFFVVGLVKKAMGDAGAAVTFFEKVLQMDSTFAETRRELTALAPGKDKKLDILNGDITEIVSSLFRSKAK